MKKIEAMHARFGIIPDKKCEDCSNLIKGYCGNTFVRKCTVYGATHSEASDWRKKYVACGLFNQEWNGGRMMEVFRWGNRIKKKESSEPLEGQIGMDL